MAGTELDLIRKQAAEVEVLQPGEDAIDDAELVPAWWWVRRNRLWLIPLASPFALFAVAAYTFTHGWFLKVLIAAVVAEAVVWFVAPRKWDRPVEQTYARVSVGAAGGWLTAASWLGPGTPLLLLVLVVGCVAWAVPWWRHKRVRPPAPVVDTRLVDWDRTWQDSAMRHPDLSGSRVIDVREQGAVESVLVLLAAGVTQRQAMTQREVIESVLGLDAGALRMSAGTRQREVWLHIRHGSPLAEEVEWDDSVAPTSIMEPGILGVREVGAMLLTVLLGNWFIIGQKRSGKSNQLSVLMANITHCTDAVAWWIDFKEGRAARPWLRSIDWFACTVEEARYMMQAALDEIKARAATLYGDDEQLEPTPENPAIFIILDEANEIIGTTRGDRTLAALAEAIASLGNGLCVYLIVATQHGSLDALRTEQLRSNLDKCMAFLVQRAEHGQYALRDWSRLDASKLDEKGMFFFQDGKEAASEPGRGQHIPHKKARALAARNESRRQPLQLVSERATQAHAGRWARLPEVFLDDAPEAARQWQNVTQTTPPGEEAPMFVKIVSSDAQERADRIESELVPVSLDDLRQAQASRGRRSGSALAEAIVSREEIFVRRLAEAPDSGVSPGQLRDATQFGRTWVHEWLRSLVELGAVVQLGRGRYRAAPGEDLWKAMESVRRANDHLLDEAQQLTGS